MKRAAETGAACRKRSSVCVLPHSILRKERRTVRWCRPDRAQDQRRAGAGDPVAEVMIFPFAEMSHAADFNAALLQKWQSLHYPVEQSRSARFVIDVAAQRGPGL
jgi:hypothetical protein